MIERLSGVVSLLDMLEFYAEPYLEISRQIGLLLAQQQQRQFDSLDFKKALQIIIEDCARLGFKVTNDAFGNMFLDLVKANPKSFYLSADKQLLHSNDIDLTQKDIARLDAIYMTLRSEVGSTLMRVVPVDKTKYLDPARFKDSKLTNDFPAATRELERGGECLAYGEPTAAIFHSMRALESGLGAMADEFQVSFANDNWNTVIEGIEKAVREKWKGTAKSQSKIDEEAFWGSAAAHLYFVKNAWRNHVTHKRVFYDETEAAKIMDRTQGFLESLCGRLKEKA